MKAFRVSDYELTIRRRGESSRAIDLILTTGAILFSFALIGVALAIYGTNPIEAFILGFSYAFSIGGAAEMVVRAIPLLLVGLAVYVPLRAGLYNIAGGAGLYAGGIAAAAVSLAAPGLGRPLLGLAVIAGAVAGMFVLTIPGILRAYWDINEILTTLLLTFIFINLNSYAVKLMRGEGGTLTGERLPEAALSPTFFGTRIHAGIFLAIVAFAASYLLFKKTTFGYAVDMFGTNPTAAVRSGISSNRIIIGTFVIGGLFSGIAGAFEILGVHGRLLPDFSPGYGFTAIAIAIIARDNIFRVLGATFLFSFVYIWGARIELLLNVPSTVIAVFEATVILFFLLGEGLANYDVSLKNIGQTEPEEVPAA